MFFVSNSKGNVYETVDIKFKYDVIRMTKWNSSGMILSET